MKCGEHFIGASDHFAEVCERPKGHEGGHSSKAEERQPNTELRERKLLARLQTIAWNVSERKLKPLDGRELQLEAIRNFAASIQAEAQQQIEELKRERDCAKKSLDTALANWKASTPYSIIEELKRERDKAVKAHNCWIDNALREQSLRLATEKQLAEARAQAIAAIAVLKGYEQWEANLLMCHESWGENDTPRITQELWDELVALQTRRNNVAAALERAAEGK